MADICKGCGAKLQSEEPTRPGYVPPALLTQRDVICQRCFKISHYNELTPVSLDDDDYVAVMNLIGQKRALVVKIVDLFDFNGSWLSGLTRLVNFNPILVAVNKIDLFPKVNWGRVRNWIDRYMRQDGLKPVDVVFLSGRKGIGIDTLLEAINKHRPGRHVYVVGATNVGKSTIINRILLWNTDKTAETAYRLTTSRFPGTTLDLIDIPLPNGIVLHDTPGVINRRQMAHYVSVQDLKQILPEKRIKPKIYQLDPGQTLFFGGLARLDFQSGERQSFVCYMADSLRIHRSKLKKADQLYETHLGGLLYPPRAGNVKELGASGQANVSFGP